MDLNVKELSDNNFLIIDCYRIVDPESETAVYNDHWVKQYVTSLIKRQWGLTYRWDPGNPGFWGCWTPRIPGMLEIEDVQPRLFFSVFGLTRF